MTLRIYTDGSSLGNPGPGGFCALIQNGKEEIIAKGGDLMTTNNRMEMSAIIAGLFAAHKHFPKEKTCEVFSDSNLIIQTLRMGWKRKKNLDLWQKLDAVAERFVKIDWRWIRGHAGHPQNTRADKIAVAEAKKQKKLSGSPTPQTLP